MSYRTDRRRSLIRRFGRQMMLSRPNGSASLSVLGYAPPPQSAQITADTPQASFICQITSDELRGSSYCIPLNADRLTDGDRTYTLTDATPVYDGPSIAGWTLIAAGGEVTA